MRSIRLRSFCFLKWRLYSKLSAKEQFNPNFSFQPHRKVTITIHNPINSVKKTCLIYGIQLVKFLILNFKCYVLNFIEHFTMFRKEHIANMQVFVIFVNMRKEKINPIDGNFSPKYCAATIFIAEY